jgi:hypothetical protein
LDASGSKLHFLYPGFYRHFPLVLNTNTRRWLPRAPVSYRSEISSEDAERLLLAGLDELERGMLDPRVSNTASARVFLPGATPLTRVGTEGESEKIRRRLGVAIMGRSKFFVIKCHKLPCLLIWNHWHVKLI